jgi:hypothetical protein
MAAGGHTYSPQVTWCRTTAAALSIELDLHTAPRLDVVVCGDP